MRTRLPLETVAMDKGYGVARIHDECAVRDALPVIAQGWRLLRLPHPRLCRRRSAVEREFGRLKRHYGLAVRVRGIERVRLHEDLTILGRLALELAKTRAASPSQ